MQWRWVVGGLLAYVALLAAAAVATLVFRLPLASGGGFLVLPSAWGLFLIALMYGGPLILALVTAALKRPFWPHFLVVIGLAVALQALYGAAALALRGLAAQDWTAEIAATERAAWRIDEIAVATEDENDDGLVERVTLTLRLDPMSLPAGDYALRAALRPASTAGLSGAPTAAAGRDLALAGDATPFEVTLALSPTRVAAVAAEGETALRVDLDRWMTVPPATERLLQVCAWAALFCPTRISGYDPVIQRHVVQLPVRTARLRIDLPPERVRRDQVTFRRFLGDRGRDSDGDGRYDALVIAVELESLYQGPLYAQAYLDAAQRFLPTFESRIARGRVAFEYVVDGAALARLARDGPYRITDFYLMNNTPVCPQVQCPNDNKPMFSLRLPSYTTGAYRAADFE